jgi:hypothetical protein
LACKWRVAAARRWARSAFLVGILWALGARAQPSPEPPLPPSPSPSPSGELAYPWPARPGVVGQALERFEFGDYEGVVTLLRPVVESDRQELPPADRAEALRTYGIACLLTGRRIAAEGAFVLLLRAEPSTHLDPRLVRPEAVSYFEEVRARYRAELVTAYRKGRPHRYWFLNLLPPVGQFQNRERKKGYAFGAAELVLLATNLTTGLVLRDWEGPTHEFTGHVETARALMPVNLVSFVALLTVVAYGIVDGFVVGQLLTRKEKRVEERLLSTGPGLRIEGNSFVFAF